MSLADISRDDVRAAISKCDQLGTDQFLVKYGFRRSPRYVLVYERQSYEPSAVLGVAHTYATGQALAPSSLSGGEEAVQRRLNALGFDVRSRRGMSKSRRAGARGVFGDIPGVEEKQVFANRKEAHDLGVHRALQAGIVGTGAEGAESIVVSGGYEDDRDYGSLIIYTGHGGQSSSKMQIADQSFESSGNAALQTSKLTGIPVRVVRGAHRKNGSRYAPDRGYRYDGLFRAEDAWQEKGLSGFYVCRFRLRKLDTSADSASEDPEEDVAGVLPEEPAGNAEPGRRAGRAKRIVRSAEVANYVKAVYGHQCQTCGVELVIGNRRYAEGAHIRGLGEPHRGPDVPGNMLCLCPNCHILFDNGALIVNDDLSLELNGKPAGVLRVHEDHMLMREQLEYHRSIHPLARTD